MYPDTITEALKTLGFTATDGGGGAPKSLKDLNKRYHLLALRHHPDKVGSGGDGGGGNNDAIFKEINEAYQVLSN
jgi:preprotein translocase subunit Sec63